MDTLSNRCSPSRFDKIETEIEKIKMIEHLVQTTLERIHDFATKNEVDKLMYKIDGMVTNHEFGQFMQEDKDFKKNMISVGEFKDMKNDLDIL